MDAGDLKFRRVTHVDVLLDFALAFSVRNMLIVVFELYVSYNVWTLYTHCVEIPFLKFC